ncbi:ATP/GTP-binding protein [Dactylosporangium roseum]|uniref:ATP/GTP-binding protein n=1 Tax=Dactylosporangium roseum TaxID=47989 RepID=A0ABY5Z104_9ACTN|nr:ATP/GTP-binding protein [Dactylosporangium roseum]UWZ34458.1 ATP/GTP-binding protein [Dactylosporangium roseum]
MAQQPTRVRRPTRTGYAGPGGGRHSWIEAPTEYRGTTVQVCGLWPFGTGSATPMVGVPIGRHLYTGATVCFDPISWYTRARLINNPSVFIESEPGMGKSTAVRRMVLGLTARGVTPLILGDLKPDYAALVAALGGQVIRVGPGLDRINPLDAGPWRDVLSRADAKAAAQIRAVVADRRLNMLLALATLARRGPVGADEATVMAAALRYLGEREGDEQPVLSDVVRVIRDAPPEVRAVTLWHRDSDIPRYQDDTANLQRTMLALLHGALGSTFEGQTTVPIDFDTPAVCVDISSIDESDELRTAAALLTTWSYGFGKVEAAHRMADLGLAPPRTFFAVLDELWRALRVGHGLVDRADALTRLNRQKGTGVAFITHTLADLEALPTLEERAKARGFADRAAVLMIGPSSDQELDSVAKVRPLSEAERAEVLSWSAPPSWDAHDNDIVGRGNFLIKVGSRAGIPVHLEPTDIEKRLGNTDFRWAMHQS